MTLFLRGELSRSLLRPVWSVVTATCTRKIGSDAGGILVAKAEVTAFIERCMVAAGTKPAHAKALADNLTMADYRGHFSHGLNRLDMYVHDIESKTTVTDIEPKLLRETVATAHVDGMNTLGPVVGNFCMNVAISKAKEVGIGFVVAKGSNHYGIAGFYSLQAMEAGLLGLSFTNTSPLVLPTRGRKVALGTNPLTLAAPGKEDTFELDMATSTVALGKIELAKVKKQKIPSGWGADSSGQESHDPAAVVSGGGLLALGGSELSGGYKGYGLAMMVEVFCGVLAGAEFGPRIRVWKDTERIANLGQSFMAINPDMFEPGFQDRMQELINTCRSSPLATGETEVLVAGDPEHRHMAMCDKQGGIHYHPNVIDILTAGSKEVQFPMHLSNMPKGGFVVGYGHWSASVKELSLSSAVSRLGVKAKIKEDRKSTRLNSSH